MLYVINIKYNKLYIMYIINMKYNKILNLEYFS